MFVEHSYFIWTDESPVTFLDKTKTDGTADDLNIQYGYLEYRHHWKLGGESQQIGYICKGKPGNIAIAIVISSSYIYSYCFKQKLYIIRDFLHLCSVP